MGGTGNVQVAAADVVDSFIIDEESAVRVLNGAVSGEHGIVRLNDGSVGTGRRIDGELELGFLPELGSKTL